MKVAGSSNESVLVVHVLATAMVESALMKVATVRVESVVLGHVVATAREESVLAGMWWQLRGRRRSWWGMW